VAADSLPGTSLPSDYDNPLLTEGDLARGQPPELAPVIDCHSWSRLPGTDVEARPFTEKPFVLRYRSARVPQDWTAR